MKDEIYDLKFKIKQTELEVLHNIYLLRCLTVDQIYSTFYKDEIETIEKFKRSKLSLLKRYSLIEIIKFNNDNQAIFLTTKGIDLVRESFELPTDIIDDKTKGIRRGYYRASELKMLPRLIAHQSALNQFMLDFKDNMNKKFNDLVWKYYDEKYASQYISIRPDGLIRLLDMDFFLEMDMATESKQQLVEKWKHYRSFLASREYQLREHKICVFFIIEGTNNVENRKKIVKLTASEILLDIFDGDFDIYVGSKKELIELIFNSLIPNIMQTNYKIDNLMQVLREKHNFSVVSAEKLKSKINNTEYDFYIRKINENNAIIKEDGRIQEFLLDYYSGYNLSIMKKIAYLKQNSAIFRYNFLRDISYIIVCENLEQAYKELEFFGLIKEENVFFTTMELLNTKPFCRALCQFDLNGTRYSFTDNSYGKRCYD